MDISGTLINGMASAVESLLIALEDKLRPRVLSHQLSPFLLSEKDARSALENAGTPVVVASFEGKYPADWLLEGIFEGDEVTSEQLRDVDAPGAEKDYLRLRFRLPSERHGEVTVKVRDEISDWTGYQSINLWCRGRSRAAKLTLIFKDARGQRWFSHHGGILASGRWQLLRVPFFNFHCPGDSRETRESKTPDLKSVSEVTFQITCSQGSGKCRGRVDLYQAFVSKAPEARTSQHEH